MPSLNASMPASRLSVTDLHTTIGIGRGMVRAVDGLSLSIRQGEIFGIAGESGSGKSVMAFSILRLLPSNARVVSGSIRFDGQELLALREQQMRKMRGGRIGMIFQDPMSSLNPVLTIGDQIRESILQHRRIGSAEVRAEVIRLMDVVEIPSAANCLRAYPHEFSGGMRQRVMIAMALAGLPALLIADEPTTALDVTVERQIVSCLLRLRAERGLAIMLISHNVNLLVENCDRIAVMYAGQVVEAADSREIFDKPAHPYTRALLASMPRGHISEQRLDPLPGLPPRITGERRGCSFAPRCPAAHERCAASPPLFEMSGGHLSRCWLSAAGAA